MSGDEEDLAPEYPVFLPGVGVLEGEDQEGGSGNRSQDPGCRDTQKQAARGAGLGAPLQYGLRWLKSISQR